MEIRSRFWGIQQFIAQVSEGTRAAPVYWLTDYGASPGTFI
jgi:hypothetical protein